MERAALAVGPRSRLVVKKKSDASNDEAQGNQLNSVRSLTQAEVDENHESTAYAGQNVRMRLDDSF